MATIKKSITVNEQLFSKVSNLLGTTSPTEIVNILMSKYVNNEILESKKNKAKPLFPYMGRKNNKLCKEIKSIESQVKYKTYVEPFAGSLAVLCFLNLSDDISVIINDINGRLTNFYKVIKKQPMDFISACDNLPYSQNIFNTCKKQKVFESNLEDAVAYFYEKFASYYGSSTFYIKKGKNVAQSYRKNLEFINALSARLQNVQIINKNFSDVIKKYDSEDTLYYLDSPYWGSEDCYFEKEEEKGFTSKDHEELAQLLKNAKSKFIYSCRANTNIYKLYRSNKHWCIDIRYHIGKNNGKEKKYIREKLICNFKFEHVNTSNETDVKQYS